MITEIYGRNVKGFSFDQPLERLNLFVGPNGVGKSARSQALTLAILGYLPSDQVKQPGAIYAIHASAQEMIVAFKSDKGGHRFARKYRRSDDGTVSLDIGLDGKKLNQKQSEKALFDLGNPRIIDLPAFNDLSAAKKIEHLLSIFPPAGDLPKIDREISGLEEREKYVRGEIRGKQMVVEQLTGERADLKLPAGTLAELQAKIKAQEEELSRAKEDLKQAEIEEKRRTAEEEFKKKVAAAEAKSAKEKEDSARREADALKTAEAAQTELIEIRAEMGRNEERFDAVMKSAAEELSRPHLLGECLASLRTVLETLEEAGCRECAGMIVLKSEIQRIREMEVV